ncbi:MAG: cation:proton antiporter [Rhodospirillales bacterium]|nr:cation:proton antiporter [Rhodospirillales bacterium]
MLLSLVVLLGAIALAVTATRRAGLGSILGYLLAGAAIGPAGLRLVTDIGQIRAVSALGIIMLLFLIGLELRPHRLWLLRKALLGLGPGQMLPTAALIAALGALAGLPWPESLVLGAGLALSSTAIVLPMLRESGVLASPSGRDSFAVLLFQDIAFVPLVALVPLLSPGALLTHLPTHLPAHLPWLAAARTLAAVAVILFGGQTLLRPAFAAVGGARTPELFTATALLVVLGAAAIAEAAGLSPSLGAFAAGVLLSDSEYRHELKADIEPFQGLLLGFFFLSVGMSADLGLVRAHPLEVAAAVIGLIAVKAAVGFALGFLKRDTAPSALRFALALAQGSELTFVFFASADAFGVLSHRVTALATLAVALSMAATPLLFAASERFLIPRLERRTPPPPDLIPDTRTPVLICGFGRVGQIVGRILRLQRIPFTALDRSPAQIAVVRRFGGKVYFGDPARPDVLGAAGAAEARLIVVAPDEEAEVLAIVDAAKRHFPHLAILARARDRRSAHRLMDRGVTRIIRETFFSSLRLAEWVLEDLGIAPAEARRTIALFTEHDERLLAETHAIYTDEKQLIQTTQQAADELALLLDADREQA